jgi:hypothetical protein
MNTPPNAFGTIKLALRKGGDEENGTEKGSEKDT